mmetsp:Transcript_97156/g.279153  ORF Transcript_97156/g.279153 Transcript_97156/m.279153 type:complete len:217 (-) Transcript_97156:311-961(-)
MPMTPFWASRARLALMPQPPRRCPPSPLSASALRLETRAGRGLVTWTAAPGRRGPSRTSRASTSCSSAPPTPTPRPRSRRQPPPAPVAGPRAGAVSATRRRRNCRAAATSRRTMTTATATATTSATTTTTATARASRRSPGASAARWEAPAPRQGSPRGRCWTRPWARWTLLLWRAAKALPASSSASPRMPRPWTRASHRRSVACCSSDRSWLAGV